MAKRFLDSRIFEDPWFRKLKPNDKILWIYILCKCNHAGIWKSDMDLANFSIGGKINLDSINSNKLRLIKISDDKYFIPDFIKFQYGELNPNVKLHDSVLKILKNEGLVKKNSQFYNFNKNNLPQRVKQELANTYTSVKDKDKDKDKEKDNKIKYGEFVFLTENEYKKLCDRYESKEFADACIERLNIHIGSKGDTYKSHYYTILKWVVKAELETGEWEK